MAHGLDLNLSKTVGASLGSPANMRDMPATAYKF